MSISGYSQSQDVASVVCPLVAIVSHRLLPMYSQSQAAASVECPSVAIVSLRLLPVWESISNYSQS